MHFAKGNEPPPPFVPKSLTHYQADGLGATEMRNGSRLRFAAELSGANPEQSLRKAFSGVGADERNLADERTLMVLADGVGLPAQKLLTDAKSENVKKSYEQN
jgi:predicted DsbA family dithiol-disulfide isomerase